MLNNIETKDTNEINNSLESTTIVTNKQFLERKKNDKRDGKRKYWTQNRELFNLVKNAREMKSV